MNECRQVQLLHYRPDSWSKSTKAELQEEGHFILNSIWHLQKLLKNRFNRTFLNTGADQNSNRADIKGSMLNSGHGPHPPSCSWVSRSRLSAVSLGDAACVSCSHRRATRRLLDWRHFFKNSPGDNFQLKIQAEVFRDDIYRHACTSLFGLNASSHACFGISQISDFAVLPPLSPVFLKGE